MTVIDLRGLGGEAERLCEAGPRPASRAGEDCETLEADGSDSSSHLGMEACHRRRGGCSGRPH